MCTSKTPKRILIVRTDRLGDVNWSQALQAAVTQTVLNATWGAFKVQAMVYAQEEFMREDEGKRWN